MNRATRRLVLAVCLAVASARCASPVDHGDASDVPPPRDTSANDTGDVASNDGSDASMSLDVADEAVPDAADDVPSVDVSPGDVVVTDATPDCTNITMSPGTDVTAALTQALRNASMHPIAGLVGPSGQPQGRVYFPPGAYAFGPIQMPSNVRLEIAPGATLRPSRGSDGPGPGDWGLFVFGDATTPARNISFVAGDGCGGPGVPTASNKPSNTNFRGNDPMHGGMGNAAVPYNAYWPTDRMWVFDLDPAMAGCDPQVAGFLFHWAYDVRIENIFSIQNAARLETGVGPVANATSRDVVMMFDPVNGTAYTANVENQQIPHRVAIDWHYNILAPSGQGPNQVRACRDCTFSHVFAHGGSALRVETDGIRNSCGDGTCGCTGPNGQGFQSYAIVDNLVADHIEGVFGNRAVQLTPHCLPNGTVTVRNVRGWSEAQVVVIAGRQSDSLHGGFRAVNISDVDGCGGTAAQEAHPQEDSYLLYDSQTAVSISSTDPITFGGTFSWPSPPATGGLRDGNLPSGGGYTVRHPSMCSASF